MEFPVFVFVGEVVNVKTLSWLRALCAFMKVSV
jgi:hypothetical protein